MRVVRAFKLLKRDLLGASDPYVKLSLSGERLPAKKTTVKRRNLNPEWNEKFKLIVRDPQTQVLQLHVYDWDKVISYCFIFASYKRISKLKMKMMHRKSLKYTGVFRQLNFKISE